MDPFDVNLIAVWLTENKLFEKRFCDMNRTEISDFCEQVHIATDPQAGYVPPYINENQELIIPFNTPGKYRWWKGGQSIKETLEELGATEEIMKRYLDQKSGDMKRK